MKSGTDLLRLFYEEKEKWSFSFENLVQLSRLKTHYECDKRLNHHDLFIEPKENKMNFFMERSIFSSFNVFALNTYEEKKLNKVEFDILNAYYTLFKNELFKNIDADLNHVPYRIIYIRTTPEICFQRLKKRNRPSEETIDLDYLSKLHLRYEKWVTGLSSQNEFAVQVIDGNMDKANVISQIEKIL
jgi:deoxyadenosine/deoxycytidine kinase